MKMLPSLAFAITTISAEVAVGLSVVAGLRMVVFKSLGCWFLLPVSWDSYRLVVFVQIHV